MPHMIVEYSRNIEDMIGTENLFEKMCDMGVETGVFARTGIRVRGEARDCYHIADGHPENAFVHTILRVGHGRDEATLKDAGDRIYAVICDHLAALAETRVLNISMEIQEIHPVLTWKKNNTPQWMDARAAADQAAE
ncbi:MAG: 5-carboxymethyl-2-hydroxymuconate isomerase [Pseudomonadota bacterium]|nr:5-carboxymethyl-2-hydroxymuconate isomerase [Pseudomonadota bacterium]